MIIGLSDFGKQIGTVVGLGIVGGTAFLIFKASKGNGPALVILGGLLAVVVVVLAVGLVLTSFWVKDRMDARRNFEDHQQDVAELKATVNVVKEIQGTVSKQHSMYLNEQRRLPAPAEADFTIESLLADEAVYEEIEE